MDTPSSPDRPDGYARILLSLRHALADPLSSAALKLDLVERRLASPSGAEPSWLTERVRTAHAEVDEAHRLIDLLLRLAEIAGERPGDTSIRELCRAAGVPIEEPPGDAPSVRLRQRSSVDAIRGVASLGRRGDLPPTAARTRFENGRVSLEVDASRATADGHPERLLDLPHGTPEVEPLFLARATVVSDGGDLELTERGGRLVALFSWPAERKAGA
jgi:hypothetical protein